MTAPDLTIKPADKQAIETLLNEWVNARGCGSLKDRLNAALEAIETDPNFHQGHVEYAYQQGLKILQPKP